jgi:hypothetical protein
VSQAPDGRGTGSAAGDIDHSYKAALEASEDSRRCSNDPKQKPVDHYCRGRVGVRSLSGGNVTLCHGTLSRSGRRFMGTLLNSGVTCVRASREAGSDSSVPSGTNQPTFSGHPRRCNDSVDLPEIP